MASTTSLIVARILPARPIPVKAHAGKPETVALSTRRRCLLLLTATTALKAAEMSAGARDIIPRDIPLFGLRQGLREVEEIVEEGFEAADRGIVAAEKGIEATEKSVEDAEKGIEASVSFGGLIQAGIVVTAEAVGVLIATSVVNGILGPDTQKS